jgi:hypothetical protein
MARIGRKLAIIPKHGETVLEVELMRAGSNMEGGTPSVNNRSVEAVDALDVPIRMRQAAVELIASYDYEKAAWRAGVTADVVRGWAEDPLFIAALGWLVIGLADNPEC